MGDDITITYEVLFELVRREKNREDLQELPQDFFEHAQDYLATKSSLISSGKNHAENENVRTQIANAKKLVKELYDRREKKVLNLALYQVRTGGTLLDTKNLAPKERELLNALLETLRAFRASLLDVTLEARDARDATDARGASRKSPTSHPTLSPESSASLHHESHSDAPESLEAVRVKIIAEVPQFVGPELAPVGPFMAGELVTLSADVAEVLLKGGQAERADVP